MQNFTPLAGLIGGALIGLASAILLLATGRLAGISGMLEGVLRPQRAGAGLALAFLIGLPIGAIAIWPKMLTPVEISGTGPLLIAAGMLVGFGTRIANGCTSGHGVCGLPRFSVRSIAATGIFMATAMLTVFVTRHVL
jgi:uncharacterized membrane protein YedE/YeeE